MNTTEDIVYKLGTELVIAMLRNPGLSACEVISLAVKRKYPTRHEKSVLLDTPIGYRWELTNSDIYEALLSYNLNRNKERIWKSSGHSSFPSS